MQFRSCSMGQININGNDKCCQKSLGLGKALGYSILEHWHKRKVFHLDILLVGSIF